MSEVDRNRNSQVSIHQRSLLESKRSGVKGTDILSLLLWQTECVECPNNELWLPYYLHFYDTRDILRHSLIRGPYGLIDFKRLRNLCVYRGSPSNDPWSTVILNLTLYYPYSESLFVVPSLCPLGLVYTFSSTLFTFGLRKGQNVWTNVKTEPDWTGDPTLGGRPSGGILEQYSNDFCSPHLSPTSIDTFLYLQGSIQTVVRGISGSSRDTCIKGDPLVDVPCLSGHSKD